MWICDRSNWKSYLFKNNVLIKVRTTKWFCWKHDALFRVLTIHYQSTLLKPRSRLDLITYEHWESRLGRNNERNDCNHGLTASETGRTSHWPRLPWAGSFGARFLAVLWTALRWNEGHWIALSINLQKVNKMPRFNIVCVWMNKYECRPWAWRKIWTEEVLNQRL